MKTAFSQPCLAAFLAIFGWVTAGAQTPRLLGYYPAWGKTQTPPYRAANIPYAKLTHVLHAFLLADKAGDGTLNVPGDLLEPELISRAHAAGVKVSISVGGASGVQKKAFRSIAANPAYRAAFAQNLHAFVATNGYDGVDIDYEVPVTEADKNDCTLMMEAIRAEFPAPLLVSMAVTSNPPGYGNFDIPALTPIVDFFNVMTYDFHGPWTNHSGHNSPLILNPADPGQEGSLRVSINLYQNTFGVPAEKLNIGTAFYGYQFKDVAALWAFCPSDNCQNTISENYGTYIKQRINGMGWTSKYDGVGRAPYLLESSGANGFITYDDVASTERKTVYVLGVRKLGGIFTWELSADYDGQTQDLMEAMYRGSLKAAGPSALWPEDLSNLP